MCITYETKLDKGREYCHVNPALPALCKLQPAGALIFSSLLSTINPVTEAALPQESSVRFQYVCNVQSSDGSDRSTDRQQQKHKAVSLVKIPSAIPDA